MSSFLADEFEAARRRTTDPKFAEVIAGMGFTDEDVPPWGIECVCADSVFYEPMPDGKPAVIAAAVEQGELIDLVAVSLETWAMRRRLGTARVLGADSIEDARFFHRPLTLFTDVAGWLAGHGRGAVILDWRAAPRELADLDAVLCQSEALAARVTRAFAQPVPLPPLYFLGSHPSSKESRHDR